ncbi:Mycothiol S-conjugate amidase [Frondihabitans sp. 762G35]|uniref:PIG-L family deacetylase n=1 Tax=Frondihabitans sp. 762G35 TaxID=1446794 RepID=UPI000D22666A|nr:PIG-L family deacetylase [Frondihabitans sp. 762G35]ARC57760.1 Mycothiol S-conjugate amidase [Frondihabitans sp. 762G35]
MRRILALALRRPRRVVARLRAWRQAVRRGALAATPASPGGAAAGGDLSGGALSGGAALGGTVAILAHQDDDLLFQSRSVQADATAGRALVNAYLTAGDDDDESWYWQAREAGARAAYAALLGVADAWSTSVVTLGGRSVTRVVLDAAPHVVLYFFRLPDGGMDGSGGVRSGGASLRKLWDGTIDTIAAVDGSATHTLASLQEALHELLRAHRPDRITTLDHVGGFDDGDHADHHAVAYLAERVDRVYDVPHSFAGYRGYPIEGEPANLAPHETAAKEAIFFVYARSDYKTCASSGSCAHRPEGAWLSREYEARR